MMQLSQRDSSRSRRGYTRFARRFHRAIGHEVIEKSFTNVYRNRGSRRDDLARTVSGDSSPDVHSEHMFAEWSIHPDRELSGTGVFAFCKGDRSVLVSILKLLSVLVKKS